MKETDVLTEQEVSTVRTSSEDPVDGAERRASKRITFSADQCMAPCNGSELPRKAAFTKVHCRDISRSGISMLLQQEPDFDRAVIGLGKPPRLIYITVRIANVRPATEGFVVGCSFLSKVTIDA